jgi:hypothetical protein
MKKVFIFLTFLLAGAVAAYAQVDDTTSVPEPDYLSLVQIDVFWYAPADTQTAGDYEVVIEKSLYTTVMLQHVEEKEKVLACFDIRTGRVERYQILDSSNNVLYTFQRQADDTFMSTEKTGYVEIPLKIGKQEGLITFCRVTVISAATAMLSS